MSVSVEERPISFARADRVANLSRAIADLYRRGLTTREFLYLTLAVAVGVLVSGTTADPDLWGHVRFGLDIVADRALPAADIYSFTSDRAWINHEWLAEVFFAVAYSAFGATGLNLLRITIVAAVLAMVWRRQSEGSASHTVLALAVVAIGIFLRVYPVRPQLFSILLFAALLSVLTAFDARRRPSVLLLLPVIMCAWANLHGGWIVGMGMLLVWTTIRIVTGRGNRANSWMLISVTAAAGLATLMNPYGVGLWTFLRSTVGLHRPLVSDWQPMYTLPPAFWSAWIVSAVVAIVVARRARSRVDPAYAVMAMLLGCAALRVSRLDAFFALAVGMSLVPLLARDSPTESSEQAPRRFRSLTACAVVLIAAGVVVFMQRVTVIDARYPMVPDVEASNYIRQNRLSGHVLTWFDWGEYAIWHFGPELKVSMDGRRETVYSESRVDEHAAFYFGGALETSYPDRIGATFIWLPVSLPIVPHLQSAGWDAVFIGSRSVILARAGQQHLPTVRVDTVSDAPRRFPNR